MSIREFRPDIHSVRTERQRDLLRVGSATQQKMTKYNDCVYIRLVVKKKKFIGSFKPEVTKNLVFDFNFDIMMLRVC